ncbi:hypothetical protein LTR62_008765 [Meristemomyces frigidus]|uniref:Uncharacterized protein n=1 Tax=Meristemomyces frigidus TaxID=1508187 RepID=A0AAN7YGY9_9PEZI|nr:hypothetical protein LTR62_008765 [Meristemomyces frigidus]
MTKKRQPNLKTYQGPSTPSGSSHNGGAGSNDSPTATVNERLNQLRMVETAEGLQKKRDLADNVNLKSLPPQLGGILGIQQSAPPKPKLGVRIRERMRTPGPPPPQSWLGYRPPGLVSVGSRRGGKSMTKHVARERPRLLVRFSRMVDDEDSNEITAPTGLLHLALKRLAEQWELFDPEDYPALVEIPLRLRLRVLSYIGFYGPTIDTAALQALTQGDEALTFLDLAGIAGHGSLTMKKLVRVFEPTKQVAKIDQQEGLAEMWDDDATATLGTAMSIARFSTLTHLSLSHPPTTASWKDVLALSKHTPQLTHLSLAYWPRPTLTPNLTTASITSQHSPEVRAGGSHYYSGLDGDYAEPAALLRRLAQNLLCLRWLDLEGCAAWAPALGTLNLNTHSDTARSRRMVAEGWQTASTSEAGKTQTVFTTAWKNLAYINISQGWLPTPSALSDLTRESRADTTTISTELLRHLYFWLHSLPLERSRDTPSMDIYAIEKRKALVWLGLEDSLFDAAKAVNTSRRLQAPGQARPVVFDFGWLKKAV